MSIVKSTGLEQRHRIEEEFHDQKAREGQEDFYSFGALAAADSFALAALGDLHDRRLLEIGCGDGTTSVRFAKAGAWVTSIDISGEMIQLLREKAIREGVREKITAIHVGGETLDFPDESFDLIYGHSILHHLDLARVGSKLAGMLRAGGKAVFLEPLDYNPFLKLFRLLTPARRTPTEKPLTFRDISALAAHFSSWEHEEFYLFSLMAFFWYYGYRSETLFRRTQQALLRLDQAAFTTIPALRRQAWVTVLELRK